MTGIRWTLLGLYCLSAVALATPDALDTLESARAYRVVKPENTLSLLTEQSSQRSQLNLEQQFEWLHIQFSAAQKLARLDVMESALAGMIALHQGHPDAGFVSDVLNSQGIWLRRVGNLEEARLNYLCSLELASSQEQKLRTALNLGSVERNLGNYVRAKEINRAALKLARSMKAKRRIASIENNLGLVFLSMGDTQQAIQHLTLALDLNTKLARTSSEVLNGINLLNAFVQAQQWQLYQRLFPRIQRLLASHPNAARQAYLDWVHAAFLASIGEIIDEAEQARLAKLYEVVNDKGVQKLLDVLESATPLHVPRAQAEPLVTLRESSLPVLAQCRWEKYEKLGYAHILSTVKAENDG